MYNILWFDDDFTTVKSDDPIIEARRKSFKNDVEKIKNYDLGIVSNGCRIRHCIRMCI